MRHVADLCGDGADIMALSVTLFVAAGYMPSDVAVVRALHAEREGEWSFMPASCGRVTGHEPSPVAPIGRGRQARRSEVERVAAEITDRTAAPRLVAAARAAASNFAAAAGRPASVSGPRSLALH